MIDRDVVLLLVLPLLSGVVSAWLSRGARGLYCAAAGALALMAVGISLGTSWYSGLSPTASALHAGLFLVTPIAVAFWVGYSKALRARPWVSVVLVAASYVATVFVVMTLAVNLGLSH